MAIIKGLELKEGQFVVITGMEVKNDNNIFVVNCDYSISGKYAVCKNEVCLKMVKLNGELAKNKYNIVFLNERSFIKNENLQVEIITDLKAGKKKVNNYLKERENKEVIVTFNELEKNIEVGSMVKFNKMLQCGVFGETTIGTRNMYIVKAVNPKLQLKEVGKKGQDINTGVFHSFTPQLTEKILNEGYLTVYEKIETLKENLTLVNEEKKQVVEAVEVEQKQEVETVAEVEEIIQEVATTQEEEPQQEKNINVEVKFNAEKNGIELYFTEKPSKELLENLKGNGFRWARFNKCWYTKDSEEKREYLKSLNLLSDNEEKTIIKIEEVKEIEYPTIDINDIESYHISQRIIDQENNNSMFRREDTDHNEVIKRHLQSYNDEVLEALQGNTDPKHEYYSLRWLQSYKKRYFDLYVKMLTHRANNPSWMVTGRGGLNVARYNKKQDQYSKMVGNMAGLQDEYEGKIRSIKYQVKKQVKQLQQEELKEVLQNVDIKNISLEKKSIKVNLSAVNYIFEGGTVEKKVNYLNGYYTFKNWGAWRVYDEQGKEVFSTKTNGKLEDAKKWMIAKTINQVAN